jgi:hypothetical protein
MLNVFRAGLLVAGLLFVELASAQIDPNVVIGTWEGEAGGVRGQDERTLVIRALKPKDDGGWVALGNFGITGGRLGRVEIDVKSEGTDIVLRFVAGNAQDQIRLVLKGDNALEGLLQRQKKPGRGGADTSPVKLKKMSTKIEPDK